MPIYEFYCPDCHVLFSFFSKRVDTRKVPGCPRCERTQLRRQASTFAISRGGTSGDSADDWTGDLDETAFEGAMESLARDAEGIDESDPRAAAALMRSFSEKAGFPLGDAMDEAVRRMEAGEDPESIDDELGELLENEPFARPGSATLRRLARSLAKPLVDPEIYEL